MKNKKLRNKEQKKKESKKQYKINNKNQIHDCFSKTTKKEIAIHIIIFI